ncbi:MAG TPA: hypothetical protein ENK57_26170 [Polyangiaceae bacterium]|nr:hypothetical protein [Polyangiaceae bacterium]
MQFEGVLQGATTSVDAWAIAGQPVAGAISWLERLATRCCVLIVSPRNRAPGAASAMCAWLEQHGLPHEVAARLVFPSDYPEAALYIGRSHLTFSGEFPSLDELEPLLTKKA